MEFTVNQKTKKLLYSVTIVVIFGIIQLIVTNMLISLIIILNIFYFSRMILYKQLFLIFESQPIQSTQEDFQPNLGQMKISNDKQNEKKDMIQKLLKMQTFPIVSESEMLPNNIRELMLKHRLQPTVNDNKEQILEVNSIYVPSGILDEDVNNQLKNLDVSKQGIKLGSEDIAEPEEELLIKAFQKAEALIDKKIIELQSRQRIKKSDITKVQEEIKNELAKTLPEVPKNQEEVDNWVSWSPLNLNEKLLNLELYCEKCDKLAKVQDMQYELEKRPDHYTITTSHPLNGVEHTIVAKVTLDTYEMLSKPIMQEKPLSPTDFPSEEIEA